MGNIQEAERRINRTKGQYLSDLSLSNLNLTSEDLAGLMPKIKAIKTLRELDLRNNQLTTIPLELTTLTNLKMLHLAGNQINEIPPEIGNMAKLVRFHATNNQLTALPPQMGNLPELEALFLGDNQITQVPREIESLPKLRTLYLVNNPLTNQAIISLMSNLGGNIVSTNMAARFRAQNYQEVIKKLYNDQSPDKLALLNTMDTGSFQTANGPNLTGKEVVVQFLQGVPTNDAVAAELYVPATKLLLDSIFNAASKEERDTNLNILATALGDCNTPIQSLLIRSTIGQLDREEEILPELLEGIIKREALEEAINTRLKELLPANEKIEIVAALANSVFLADAENNPSNKVPLSGQRRRVPSKTVNYDFGFRVIPAELAEAFAKMVAKTDASDNLIVENGKYILDDRKVRTITEPYFANLDIRTPREKLINQFENQMQKIIAQFDLLPHYDHNEVKELLDLDAQKKEVRKLLLNAEDGAINGMVNGILKEKFQKAADLHAKLLKESVNKGTTAALGDMSTPLNLVRRRSNSYLSKTDDKKTSPKRRMSL